VHLVAQQQQQQQQQQRRLPVIPHRGSHRLIHNAAGRREVPLPADAAGSSKLQQVNRCWRCCCCCYCFDSAVLLGVRAALHLHACVPNGSNVWAAAADTATAFSIRSKCP
jgi:hypothetical protein